MSAHTNIWSYPKVYALGHAAVADILDGPIVVQEKYDGSQLSWAWVDEELHVRSKGKMQHGGGANTNKMFQPAINHLLGLDPIEGYVFRGEFFSKPKHNTLAYPRMPKNGLILYDIEAINSQQSYSGTESLPVMASGLDIEPAQGFRHDEPKLTLETIERLLSLLSSLGGPMEGIVIKNYTRYGRDGKVLMAKVVSEKFKETHTRDWKERNPNRKDIVTDIITALNTEARFEKAVQHLRDEGSLVVGPEDIGPLMKEVKRDTIAEEREWIAEQMMNHILPKVERGLGRGLPDWYKAKLMDDVL